MLPWRDSFPTRPRTRKPWRFWERKTWSARRFIIWPVAAEPQVAANEYLVEIEHPKEGKIRILNNPVTLGRRKARVGAAPELGQHTDEVLKEAGYSEGEIAVLRKEEVV